MAFPPAAHASGTDPAFTSLDPHEINLDVPAEDVPWGSRVTAADPAAVFRHSGWARERRNVRDALQASGAGPRRLLRFDLCGTDPWIVVDPADPQRVAVHCNTCRNRWCLPCAQARSHRIQVNLQHHLQRRTVRMLTLTLRHSATPLRGQLDRLYKCFRTLRQTTFWRQHVTGGCAVLEITHGWHSPEWHPHLHCLVEGKYIPHGRLSDLWRQVTGDSFIVHVTAVASTEEAAKYVAKYLRKPVDRSILYKPDPLAELIAATKGRRLVHTFASWRGFRLTAPLDNTPWEPLYPLPVLWERIAAGDADAPRILSLLNESYPGYLQACWPHPP